MPAYLTESSNAAARNYALASASDKQVTYSVSTNTDPVLSNWIDRIYEYVGRLISVNFTKVTANADFSLILEKANYTDLWDSDFTVNSAGLIRWTSVHNTKQYGGVDDQRMLVRAIGNSLGLSKLDWRWREAGNTGEYTTANTVMSTTPWDRGYDFGHTVFFTEDDRNSLREIYGSDKLDAVTGSAVVHEQRIKEDLLIGANGQADIFRLNAKGMNGDNKDAIWRDPVTGWDWVCDYNVPTIANFNPYEGDKILIKRSLYLPQNPIGPNTILPKKILVGKKRIALSKHLASIGVDFIYAGTPEQNDAALTSTHNTILNDAGKLMLNVNGVEAGNGPSPIPVNGQLVAFIDIVGTDLSSFQPSWLDLY